MSSSKTLEDVTNLIHIAKLDPSDLLPKSHILSFNGELLDTDEYKLVQVPQELLESLLSGQESLVIRGDPTDSAVICTQGSTFELKEAETSNTLLLTPHLEPPTTSEDLKADRTLEEVPVYGSFNRYFELNPIKPRLKRLEELLLKAPYSRTNPSEATGYSKEQLLNRIQASEKQLKKGLKSLDAVCISSQWYTLDEDYLMQILTLIYNFIEEKSWEASSLQVEETLRVLSENEPLEILSQVINIFAPGEEDGRFMNEDKVCRFYGKYILANGTNFDQEEFLKIWQDSVPEGFTTTISQLDGLALIMNSTVRSFPESRLPHEIQPRLEILFRLKDKWTLEEIKPYVSQLSTLKLNVNALLTKYARSSTQNGVKYFSAKHGK